MRMIFVPALPVKMRYQSFWYSELTKVFKENYDEVIVLGENNISEILKFDDRKQEMFSGINSAINFELSQVSEYMSLKLREDDTIFLSDLSYGGFFSNVLYHKPIKKSFCYLHASSKNSYDYFQPVRYSKYPCEIAHSKLFKKVFVGSKYHQDKLKWRNTEIVGLPVPPFKTFEEKKEYPIISVARPNPQKITKWIEDRVEKDFCRIERLTFDEWEDYYKFLSKGKVLLITSKEDTFNYSVMEAIINKTIVLAPNRCAFPELLSKEYLYKDWDDLRLKLWYCLADKEKPQEKLLNQDLCNNFYTNIITIMKEK